MDIKGAASNSGREMHWDKIHSGPEDSLSWEENNTYSTLDLILSCSKNKDDIIVDVGCGHSGVVLALSGMGFNKIFALDVSKVALDHLVTNLSRINRKESVTLLNKDILDLDDTLPDSSANVWHDRFTFHFLVDPDHIRRYVNLSQKKNAPGGYMVLTTYSDSSPDKCSGLPVRRYNHNSLSSLFGDKLELLSYRYADHVTTKGSIKPYISIVLKKIID